MGKVSQGLKDNSPLEYLFPRAKLLLNLRPLQNTPLALTFVIKLVNFFLATNQVAIRKS